MTNPNSPPRDERDYRYLRRMRVTIISALVLSVALLVMLAVGYADQRGAQAGQEPPVPAAVNPEPLADNYWYAVVMLGVAVLALLVSIVQMLSRRRGRSD